MSLVWHESTMGTGVPSVDEQHRRLIEKLNELLDAMKRGEGAASLDVLLDWLGSYAGQHFRHEEGCMQRAACPAAAANKAGHVQFMNIFAGLREQLRTNGASAALVLATQQQLSSWINSHIVRIDTQLRGCRLA